MLRTEKLFRNKNYKAIISRPPENNTCASDIISDWKGMMIGKNLSKTYFSDVGIHGSMKWNSSSALKFSQYIHDTLPLQLTLTDVNFSLENMTNSRDSVQMAVLHQQLVAHASCVVIVGGGSFQSQTFNLYAHNHKGQECYTVRDSACKITYTHF